MSALSTAAPHGRHRPDESRGRHRSAPGQALPHGPGNSGRHDLVNCYGWAAAGDGSPLLHLILARAGRSDAILYGGKDDDRGDERHDQDRSGPKGHASIIRPTLARPGLALAISN